MPDWSSRVLLGDCIAAMSALEAESIDAVVTDPPYGIEFMGRDWDKFIPHDEVKMAPRWKNAERADPSVANWGDGETAKFGKLPNYGGRRTSFQCQGCGKRDAFRNPHKCDELGTTDWRSVPSYAGASPEVLAFERFSQAWADAAYRILKPGGHLLAFGAPRMYHRLAAGIEDAGFEIRDSLHWIYGSGFPKSLDVAKQIDKRRDEDAAGVRREVVLAVTSWIAAARDDAEITNRDIDERFGMNGMAGHWTSSKTQPAVPRSEYWPQLLELLGVDEPPEGVRAAVDEWLTLKGEPIPTWSLREVTGQHDRPAPAQTWMAKNGMNADLEPKERRDVPASPEAQKWEGWGTALKPAHEPIIMARKPLSGTVTETVLAHGTGAINIADTRVGAQGGTTGGPRNENWRPAGTADHPSIVDIQTIDAGRWPANVLLAHLSECEGSGASHTEVLCAPGCPVAELNEVSGTTESKRSELTSTPGKVYGMGKGLPSHTGVYGFDDSGGAARFFYIAKPRTREKVGGTIRNLHPTVKPIDLMRHLVRLVTPPDGIVLDPFLGSGTTGCAAMAEGFRFIGIEQDGENFETALARISDYAFAHGRERVTTT